MSDSNLLQGLAVMDGLVFHDKMHALIFRGPGASRLGAVQTTIVWQFVVFHFAKLDGHICSDLIRLQENINALPRGHAEVEIAIALLLQRIEMLDTGGR